MKIVADNKIPFLDNVFASRADVVFVPGDQITRNDLLDADALFTRSITKCNETLLKGTNVKFIATATIGDNHIDKFFCEKNNIQWANAAGCNSGAVEQYVLAAILNLAKKNGLALTGMVIGIIGVGNIGSRIEKLAKALGIKVLLNDPPRAEKEGRLQFTELDELLQKADIITIHVPLTIVGNDKTFHLADISFFESIKKPLMFINTSRGEVVETKALKKAIQAEIIKYTVIDVWENEPDIDKELLGMVDIASPHVAGYSIQGKANGTAMGVNAISRFFDLGIDNWYPEIKMPEQSIISVDCAGKNDLGIIREMINATYDIERDDREIRALPNKFESLRGNYPFRHEIGEYHFEMKNCNGRLLDLVNKLGFKIKNK
jgi:erythronate-4-phosphate dehydrogenase